jgi:DNA-binding PadR family transcriptional regulator
MAVREGLLALLREQESYGYQLKTGFERATGGVWPLNVGQVYKTLDRLERDGLITSVERDGQKSYAITVDGIDELGAWWEAVPADEPPPRDELMLKVLMAVNVGRAHALDVVADQREAVMAQLQLQQRARRRPRAGRDEGQQLADQLVHDALVMRAEADLRWLDQCEERLLSEAKDESTGEAESETLTRTRTRTETRGGGRPGLRTSRGDR